MEAFRKVSRRFTRMMDTNYWRNSKGQAASLENKDR